MGESVVAGIELKTARPRGGPFHFQREAVLLLLARRIAKLGVRELP
jgi:hypothetical protein